VAVQRLRSAYSFQRSRLCDRAQIAIAIVCALYLASVTAPGGIANAAGDEIDSVVVQHEVGGIPGWMH